MKRNPKLEKLLTKYAAVIDATGKELAMNFAMPADFIIGMACDEMGITRKTWDELASYRIEKEQAANA